MAARTRESFLLTRFAIQPVALLIALGLLVVFDQTLEGGLAKFLIDKNFDSYPLTIQNVMWVVFCLALGDVVLRFLISGREAAELKKGYLPQDEQTLLQPRHVGQYYKAANEGAYAQIRFLPRLISRVILQFQSSRSVDQANSLLNSSLELFMHEIDLRYNMLRYYVWVLPTLGFVGTVIGIASALTTAAEMQPDDPALLAVLADKMGTAFYTTLLALLMSAVVVMLMQWVQAREEGALNHAGQYCVDNLVNRLYEQD